MVLTDPLARSDCLQRLGADPAAALLLELRPLVLLPRQVRELVLQLQIALEPGGRRARPSATAAFTAQRGSSRCRQSREVAAGGVALDVVEGLLHGVADVPELQLAHARRVESSPPPGTGTSSRCVVV